MLGPIDPPLSLEVAAGILVAAAVIFAAGLAAAAWRNGEGNMSVLLWFATLFFGAMVILAGFGFEIL
ncbi:MULTISPECIES: hypothetical protein [unclassified Phaeobacter]|uniref:hypothetical protein n=1 Tax=unclassified Phaeobacter TaxID=2621772 RepID=UPI003A843CB9